MFVSYHRNVKIIKLSYTSMKNYPISFIIIQQNIHGYDGDGYSLLYHDIATTAFKGWYHIIRNGYYTIRGSAAQRYTCNRCVPYKGDVKYCNSKNFRLKIFHNDAKNTRGPEGKKNE